MNILIVGRFTADALEGSYQRAFRQLGHVATPWDMPAAIARHTRLGRFGALVNGFLPVEPWIGKANRELFLSVMDLRPDVLVVTGTTRVMASALSQIKAAHPGCKLVLIWPDTLLNCRSYSVDSIPLYDLVATYSKSTLDSFSRLGARCAAWVPLGFDPELHPPDIKPTEKAHAYGECDASFVGNYSLQREAVMVKLVEDGVRVKVWGPLEWKRSAINRRAFAKYWQGGPLFAKDFVMAIKSAPISLNPIDPANYPAANMRFFEILGCGGVPISARCPELADEFPDRERCFYYGQDLDVTSVVRTVLGDVALRERVRQSGQAHTLAVHTYAHRAEQIIKLLGRSVESEIRCNGLDGM